MKKEELQNITKLFEKAETALSNYNEEDILNILNMVSDKLNGSDNKKLSDLGESLDTELFNYYVTDDELEDLVKQCLYEVGVHGVACMLDNYNYNYNVHYINDYGNIEDDSLYKGLEDLLGDYKEEFEKVVK